jgi:nitroreductase
MEVGVPGWFHTVQPVHIDVLDNVVLQLSRCFAMPPPSVLLHLVVYEQLGFDSDLTRSMLLNFRQVSKVTVVDSSFVLTDAFLAANSLHVLVIFTPNIFPLRSQWPFDVPRRRPGRPFVWQFPEAHPDLAAAGHLFRVRQSPRVFLNSAVPEPTVAAALEAARRAPSAGNCQAYSVFVITNRTTIEQLAAAARQERMMRCSGVLAFVAEPGRSSGKYGARGRDLYALQDATIACAHAQLALEAVGVQSRWIGAFKGDLAGPGLGVKGSNIAGFLIFGRGAGRDRPSRRREQGEYITILD